MTTPPEPAPAPQPTPPTPAPAPPTPAPAAPAPSPQPAAPPAPAPQPAPVPTPPTWQPPAPAAPPDDSDELSKLPQWAQKKLTETRQEAAKYRTKARSEAVLRHAYATAGDLGANPAALLGSVAFTTAAEQLDPTSAEFPAQLAAAITATLQANPWMAAQPAAPPPAAPAAPAPPPRGSGDFPGGTGAGAPISEEQLAQMSPEQVEKALADGKLRHLM